MKKYIGIAQHPDDIAGDVFVEEDGHRTRLSLCLDHVNHSPTGFAWNYHGSGPAQLAYAILFDTTKSRAMAQRLYQRFKGEYIATLGKGDWELEEDVVSGWIWEMEEEDAIRG